MIQYARSFFQLVEYFQKNLNNLWGIVVSLNYVGDIQTNGIVVEWIGLSCLKKLMYINNISFFFKENQKFYSL